MLIIRLILTLASFFLALAFLPSHAHPLFLAPAVAAWVLWMTFDSFWKSPFGLFILLVLALVADVFFIRGHD